MNSESPEPLLGRCLAMGEQADGYSPPARHPLRRGQMWLAPGESGGKTGRAPGRSLCLQTGGGHKILARSALSAASIKAARNDEDYRCEANQNDERSDER